jgi:SecD/SecF fusion protein
MSFDLISTVLFGQSWLESSEVMTLLKLFIAIPLPIFLGTWLAKKLRLPDLGWKLSLIFFSLAIGGVFLVSYPLKLGVDLKGGVILVYEIDREAREAQDATGQAPGQINWGHLLQRLNDRINPAGTKEIIVRRYGEWQVEIIIPDVDTNEVERIKKLISTAGSLQFRIVANSVQHGDTIQAATQQAEDPAKRRSKYIVQGDRQVGYWARVGREANEVKGGIRPLKVSVANYTIRNSATGELIQLPPTLPLDQEYALEQWLKDQSIQDLDVLMYVGDEYNVTGENLGMVSRGYDEVAQPCVMFNMKTSGAGLMGGLTGDNLPDEQRGQYSLLGIMLDGSLLSAPRVMSTITDSGRITGQFTQEEVDFLVGILQAGSLPAALKKVPIAQNTIGAIVGDEMIRRGKLAAGLALASTFVFMILWYRLAGLVACFALAVNLLLTLAVMKFPLRAPLTLPGLAGLVLGVGMAVDANVLVFERIREELERGAALRMAIRNGFDRAMVTIIDSNLTTLITALVMYVIGTDQVRGFAITLTLGILISMYTAVFCTRVVFDIFDRKRLISTLRMTKLLGVTHVDFLGKKYIAITASIVFIVAGLVAVGVRGKQIFDIDFLGGTSVTMVLRDSADEREIRTKLDERFSGMRIEGSAVQYSVNRVDVEGQKDRTVWKIDSSLEEVEQLEDVLQEVFPVATHSVAISGVTEKRIPIAVPPEGEPAGIPEPTAADSAAPAVALPPQVAEPAPEVKQPETKPEQAKPDEPQAEPAKPEAEAKAEAVPEPAPEAEAKPVPQPEPKAEAEAKAETMPEPASEPEPKPEPQPEPKPEAQPEPDSQPETQPEPEPKPEATPEVKPEPAPEPKAEVPSEGSEKAPAENAEGGSDGQPKEAASDAKPAGDGAARRDLPPATMLALAGDADNLLALADDATEAAKPAAEPAAPTPEEKPATAATPSETAEKGEPADAAAKPAPSDAQPGSSEEAKPAAKPTETVLTETTLTFDYRINGETVLHEIMEAAEIVEVLLTEEDITVNLNAKDLADNPDWTLQDSLGYKEWVVTLAKDRAEAQKVLDQMAKKMSDSPVWSTSSKIGGKVAGDTRNMALVALAASWIGIVIYIWIRFQKVVFGLAAVVALIHDVLVALGAVAISYWLAGFLGFMGIQEFKISLTVVVAFLTIIGYSVNDTIVVFDRIREVRGKSSTLTQDMVNLSVNQTLARTLLTGLCTMINTIILFAIGGEGVHAFAYALFIGFVSGTYSSIYVASPFVLWLYGGKPATRAAKS